MNKFSVQSKGVFLIQDVDYQTALITAKSHVIKTTQACHIIALASPHKVWVTVFQIGYFPLAEHDAGMVAKHYVELGDREQYRAKCDAEIKEFFKN
jgi:hypothetical protein